MTNKRRVWLTTLVMTMVVAWFSMPLASQTATKTQDVTELWRDFVHYIRIAKPDLAKSFGEAILDCGASPSEIYLTSKDIERLEDVLSQGQYNKDLDEVISRIREVLNVGFRTQAASFDEIAKSIEMMGGTLTQYRIAVNRLKESGEYALPQLISKLVSYDTSDIVRDRIITVLPELGPVAVRGMTAALQSDKPELQEALASALGRIKYYHAAARMKELSVREGILERVREAAENSLVICGGQDAMVKSTSELFYALAEKYHYQAESLLPDSRHKTANVWYWDGEGKLSFKAVPRAIFCDVYAMRMAKLALKYDQDNWRAASLWLAANLKKEADLPAGSVDPTRKAQDPGAKYYALAAGPRYLLDILARGLRDGNSAISAGAIEALALTGGAESLVKRSDRGVNPLVEALSFPDLRVRFRAAVSLADALPRETFEGSQVVVMVLNQALRQEGKKTALLVCATQRSNELMAAARAAGYEVISQADPDKAIAAARAAEAVDVVILSAEPNPLQFIRTIRSDSSFAVVPVVVAFESTELSKLTETDTFVTLIPADTDANKLGEVLSQATNAVIGKPLTQQEADEWAIRATEVIRLLGETDNKVYDIERAIEPLVALTKGDKSQAQVAAAHALAVIELPKAQTAITQLACSGEAELETRLKAFASLSESLRRYGMNLPDAEVQAVLNIVTSEEAMSLRYAAAQALGAMNLPSEKIKSLVLDN